MYAIRSYYETRKNVIEYVNKNGDKAWKDIWITMTINSQNFKSIKNVIDDWRDFSNKIGFQFHTPFMKNDPLWIPFGKLRDKIVDELIEMKETKYKDYIVNPTKQLEIMKKSWGGKETIPIDCPTWTMLSVITSYSIHYTKLYENHGIEAGAVAAAGENSDSLTRGH